MGQPNNNRNDDLIQVARICAGIPDPKGDGFAANVFNGVADLYKSIDNTNLHVYVSLFSLSVTLHLSLHSPDTLKSSTMWETYAVKRKVLGLSEYDRNQFIAYLERCQYKYEPPFRLTQPHTWLGVAHIYRLRWSGDDFDIVRVK